MSKSTLNHRSDGQPCKEPYYDDSQPPAKDLPCPACGSIGDFEMTTVGTIHNRVSCCNCHWRGCECELEVKDAPEVI